MSDPRQDIEALRAILAAGFLVSTDAAGRRGWDAGAAADFILAYLRRHGPTAGEVLVTEASRGNPPHDGRAFGAVFLKLSRRGLIVKRGHTLRTKGHNGAGGLIWALAEKAA